MHICNHASLSMLFENCGVHEFMLCPCHVTFLMLGTKFNFDLLLFSDSLNVD